MSSAPRAAARVRTGGLVARGAPPGTYARPGLQDEPKRPGGVSKAETERPAPSGRVHRAHKSRRRGEFLQEQAPFISEPRRLGEAPEAERRRWRGTGTQCELARTGDR